MSSIRKEIVIDAGADEVWAAVRDVGAVHQRLVPGILLEARRDGDARVVTFANGIEVRELIVDIDDTSRRFVYAAVGGRARHHNASMQVFAESDNRSRLVWITDVLPDSVVPPIAALIEDGARVMKRTLERQSDIIGPM